MGKVDEIGNQSSCVGMPGENAVTMREHRSANAGLHSTAPDGDYAKARHAWRCYEVGRTRRQTCASDVVMLLSYEPESLQLGHGKVEVCRRMQVKCGKVTRT